MGRGHAGLPRAITKRLSRQRILGDLQRVDNDGERRERVLRLETAFRRKVQTHVASLPTHDAILENFPQLTLYVNAYI